MEIYEKDILETRSLYGDNDRGLWLVSWGNEDEYKTAEYKFKEINIGEVFGYEDFYINMGRGKVVGNKYEM